MGKVLGVIPARLESTRLPRKPLRLICGRPLVVWVYERARRATCLDRLLVATDAEEVAEVCRQEDIPVMMTSPAHRSGTDRAWEVLTREPADLCVNIQGDEPMISREHLELLLRPFRDEPETRVSTLKVAIDAESARNPHNVKVVTDLRGRALYFSRALVPCDQDGQGRAQYYKHLGIYAYTRAALEKFHNLPPSRLEQLEGLEQLRFLENGIPINVMETSQDTIGVDTEEDLGKVEEFFRQQDH
jgi:3-deoxy-manno-octulosonate cytidylyltransferase (CMP-KDO synthetase)